MSRQRSHSSGYRRFPWEEPSFDPQKIVATLDKIHMGQHGRDHWKEKHHSERRHSEHHQHKRYSAETLRRSSPHRGPAHFDDVRRGPPQTQHNRNYAQRDLGWRRDQPERGSRERFRERSPIKQENNQRGQGTVQHRRRVPIHIDTWIPDQNSPDTNRNRDKDDSSFLGYGREKPLEQRFSADHRRDDYDRNSRGPNNVGQNRNEPVEERLPPRWEQYNHSRELDFPPPRSRSMSREDERSGHLMEDSINDGYQDARRSPVTHEGPSFTQYTDRPQNRERPNNRGRGFRGGFNRRGRGRGAYSNHSQQHGEYQHFPNEKVWEEQRIDQREPSWEEQEVNQVWEDERRRGKEREEDEDMSNFPREEVEMQHLWELRGHDDIKPNMMVITEETMTIKVDMSRPVNKNSAMLYSADKQLSLDLIHVGRQRLDFLNTADNRSHKESAVQHTGTFAQEIITLTHRVKELYFGGQGITLNERFSAPQRGGYDDDEEAHDLTLSERFSSNRRLKSHSDMDSDDSLFMRQGPLQLLGSSMARDPDDLRHDLEKRRQERLEGVKVTIAGQTETRRSHMAPPLHNSQNEEALDEPEFSKWSEEPHRRQDGPTGLSRGGPFRSNGPFRRNNRYMRRPNYRHNNNGGPNW